jgi:hypothetical protein
MGAIAYRLIVSSTVGDAVSLCRKPGAWCNLASIRPRDEDKAAQANNL